jgi:hypothetical protein
LRLVRRMSRLQTKEDNKAEGVVMKHKYPNGCTLSENSNYKNRNYYWRHVKKIIPEVEYVNMDEALARAGLDAI